MRFVDGQRAVPHGGWVLVAAALGVALACSVPAATAQQGRGPMGRRTRVGNEHFATGAVCALCHTPSSGALALTTATGEDASPHGLWSSTMMANAFRDPYWRAQMASEVERHPEREQEIEGLCLTCHAPMAHHTERLAGRSLTRLEQATADPLTHSLALDGVSCTVCHQARPDGLGSEESFSGGLDIRPGARIFGPYPEPFPTAMRMHSGFTPEHGPHVQSSALCGSCHTLRTAHTPGAKPFLEQAPYLEWRNSSFSDEGGASAESRSCQECHMADLGSMRIARAPAGFDFNIAVRDHVRGHAFVGGNAFMLDLLREHKDELGVEASAEDLARTARATRAQLAHSTARVSIDGLRRVDGRLEFDVGVENLCGHKFPTGYPARRAWLEVEVRLGSRVVFLSGRPGADGRIQGVEDELSLPHRERVEEPHEVVVYEFVGADAEGRATTSLVDMARPLKDNRLLPRGWRANGPHAGDTAPVGVDGDADFVGGSDTVRYSIEVPDAADGRILVIARLQYQSVPPAWVDGLRGSATAEARRFVGWYDAADRSPEAISFTSASLP